MVPLPTLTVPNRARGAGDSLSEGRGRAGKPSSPPASGWAKQLQEGVPPSAHYVGKDRAWDAPAGSDAHTLLTVRLGVGEGQAQGLCLPTLTF